MEDVLLNVLGWTSPIGLGVFLAGVGIALVCLVKSIYFLARTEKIANPEKGGQQ